jgi:hypothetical protein
MCEYRTQYEVQCTRNHLHGWMLRCMSTLMGECNYVCITVCTCNRVCMHQCVLCVYISLHLCANTAVFTCNCATAYVTVWPPVCVCSCVWQWVQLCVCTRAHVYATVFTCNCLYVQQFEMWSLDHCCGTQDASNRKGRKASYLYQMQIMVSSFDSALSIMPEHSTCAWHAGCGRLVHTTSKLTA